MSIASIKYGSRFNGVPINEIQFIYKSRLRHEQSYIGGQSFLRNIILSDIKIIGNGVGFRNYSLVHDVTSLNYERLINVTEKNGDDTKSYNPTIFEYENTEESITLSPKSTILSLNPIPIVPPGYVIPENHGNTYDIGISGDFEPNSKSGLIRLSSSSTQRNSYIFYPEVDSDLSTSVGTKIFTGGMFDDLFIVNCLSGNQVSGYKMMQNQAWCIAKTNYNTDVSTFSIYSKNSIGTNPAKLEYEINYFFPRYSSYDSHLQKSSSYTTHKKFLVGDFNGDNITDVIVVELGINFQYDYFDRGTNPSRESNPDDIVITPTKDPSSGKAYFVNLDKRLKNGQVDLAGIITGQLNNNVHGTLRSVLSSGDVDGDGKTDIIVNRGNVIDVYSLDTNNNLIKIQTTTFPKVGISDPTNIGVLLGDYNGDGKVDYDPSILSTGTSFSKVSYTGRISGQTLRDFNNDGKTDGFSMTMVGTQSFALKFSSSVSINNLTYKDISYATDIPYSSGGSTAGLSILESTSLKKKNEIGIFKSQNDIKYLIMNKDFSKEKLLKSITSGNGVKESITYSSLNNDEGVYTATGALENYPYQDIVNAQNFKIVSKLEKQSRSVYKKQLFSYYGAVSNIDGVGFLGFRSTVRTNWHDDSSPIISNISKYDIELRGANIENYTVLGLHEPLFTPENKIPRDIVKVDDYTVIGTENLIATQQITLKPNTWIKSGSVFLAKINPEANSSSNAPIDYITKSMITYESELLPNRVFKLKKINTKEDKKVEGINSEIKTNYDYSNNPVKIITLLKEGATVAQTSVEGISYKASTESPYIIGRIESKTKDITVAGDISTSEEVYEYNSNQLLSKIKKKGDASTNYVTEDRQYDIFGNIINKTITAGANVRVMKYEYDSSGRFLTKSVDVEDLITSYVYNPNGTLKSESNPYGLTTSYEYDSWFKKTKKTDYLLKSKNYYYTRNIEKTTVKITGDDGSVSEEIFDDLGRKIILRAKNINDVFSYVSYEYDIQDRNYKTSEPYFGTNPTQWNETKYDVYGRVIKNTSFTNKIKNIDYNGLTTTVIEDSKSKTFVKNAIGKIVSVTDSPGGTIVYTYFANGNLKESDYAGIKMTLTQDGWGRKSTLLDPSAGLFKYEYNDFNEITSEQTPNGKMTYEFNNVGRLTKKTISGNNTNTTTSYNYDTTKLLSSSIFQDLNEGGSITNTFIYDGSKRVIKLTESTPYAVFTKDYSYDPFGRIDIETSTATIVGKISGKPVKVKNTYKNGAHWQILDDATTQPLWQTNSINARGQLLTATMSNGNIAIIKVYDNYGFMTQVKQDRVITNPGNITTLNTVFDAQKGNLTSRSNTLFGWNERFKYDALDRLTEYTNVQGQQETQLYDEKGRITQNNLGFYDYDKSKPYQNASISLTPDTETYYISRPTQIISYNTFKSPVQIEEIGVDKINFTYNDGNMRSTIFYGDFADKLLRKYRKHYSADGSMEIKENRTTGTVEFITYIDGDGYSAPIVVKSDGITQNYLYLQRDYLGSIIAISNESGYVQEKRLFNAWGSISKVEDGAGNILSGLTILDRGYTGHEHIQSVGLINMNGRLYDNKLHRFLQPDNNIQDPFNTQNYNRYGYVLNNPLKYRDPSGEFWEFFAGFLFSTYVRGGAASGGELNPFKWDSNTWTDALSGAASSLGSYGLSAATNNYVDNYSNKPELGTNIVYSGINKGSNYDAIELPISKTETGSLQLDIIPENPFIKFDTSELTEVGTPKIINTNSKATFNVLTGAGSASVDQQLYLGFSKFNIETSKTSITFGAGISVFGRVGLGSSITLSADVINSNIDVNGYGNWNGDQKSTAVSFGVKALGILDAILSRVVPISVMPSPVFYNTIVPITTSEQIMY